MGSLFDGGPASHPIGSLTADRVMPALMIAAFVGAAALCGLVIATGNPILIAMAVGGVGALFLVAAPMAAVWAILVGVLLVTGQVFMHFPQLIKLGWLFSLLGFFLLGMAVLYPAVTRHRFENRVPAFVPLLVAFMLLSFISIGYSAGPLNEAVTALKRYYQYIGLAFFLAVFPLALRTVRHFVAFLGVVVVANLVFALYQRFMIVPKWNYLNGVKGFVALDMVVGAFEGMLGGGGSSGILVFMSIVAAAYIVAAYRQGLFGAGRMLFFLVIALAPIALGETKVVLFYLPLALFAIYVDLVKKHPSLFIIGAILAAGMMIGLGWLYLTFGATDGRQLSVSDRLREAIAYNFGDSGYYGKGSLNRITAITFWAERHGLDDPFALMFGHGIGSSYGSDGRVEQTGHMHDMYRGKAIGLTGISIILWDLGVVGVLLYLSAILAGIRLAFANLRRSVAGFDRALCTALLASALMFFLVPFYNDAILSVPSIQVLFGLTFGLLAWRHRTTEPALKAPPEPVAYPWASFGQAPLHPRPQTPVGPAAGPRPAPSGWQEPWMAPGPGFEPAAGAAAPAGKNPTAIGERVETRPLTAEPWSGRERA